ncbi:AbrB family transcriptional regulator [Halalkaliarchaeum desulfuricum]|uniref:AbrB family transcriptional regulator n=1 Tax=Halalkaliarchaeum desulfuricum TaxID=2055893 RepID=A0A343TNT2_9EURY|nr:AbrB family transcriptional regulator [Halalkaliarchaeum desulfuricum]
MTSKGQVTIPKRIRDELGLSAGTKVEFVLDEDGTIRVRPKEPPLQRLRDVKERLAAHEVDIEKMRRESKDEWSSHLEADDT